MPALMYTSNGTASHRDAPHLPGQWVVLRDKNAQGQWVSEWWDASLARWREQADNTLAGYTFATMRLRTTLVASSSPTYQLIRGEIFSHTKLIRDAVIGGLMINLVALSVSFYSMQVYRPCRTHRRHPADPVGLLTLGVLAAVAFELVVKRVRSRLYEQLIDEVDHRLSRTVFMRLLSVRLDQLPQSVRGLGSANARLRDGAWILYRANNPSDG